MFPTSCSQAAVRKVPGISRIWRGNIRAESRDRQGVVGLAAEPVLSPHHPLVLSQPRYQRPLLRLRRLPV